MKYLPLLPLLLLAACRPAKPETTDTTPVNLEDFYQFYQKFHRDTLYQLDHITFPLKGLPAHADSATLARDDYFWNADQWTYHRPVDFETSDFVRDLRPVNEEMIVEYIRHKNGQMGMTRRFAKIAGEWYLIYFADLNQLSVARQQ